MKKKWFYLDFIFGAVTVGGFSLMAHHAAFYDIPFHWAFWDHGTIGVITFIVGGGYWLFARVGYHIWKTWRTK